MNDSKLTSREQKRYEICKKQISDGLQTCFDTGTSLIEIRDFKLYREEFETFEAFCQQTYQIGRAYAYRLIEAANVKEALEMSPIGDKITNESQARELAKVPENQRERVVKQIVKAGDPVTAETIKEKAAEIVISKPAIVNASRNDDPPPEDVEDAWVDEVGYTIPAKVRELWTRGENEVQELMSEIQQIKRRLTTYEKAKDPLFVRNNFTVLQADLSRVWSDIKTALPYAVCPTCNGQLSRTCSFCEGNGFIGEFLWKSAVTKEDKELRAKLVKT